MDINDHEVSLQEPFLSLSCHYLTTFLRTSTDISSNPHTSCSRFLGVNRVRRGTGTIQDMPSRTAPAWNNRHQAQVKSSLNVNNTLGTSVFIQRFTQKLALYSRILVRVKNYVGYEPHMAP